MTGIQHKPAPGRKPGIEERIAAAGRAQAERYGQGQPAGAPAHGAPEDSIHGGHRA